MTFGYKLSHIFRKRYDFKNVENIRLSYAFEVEGIKYYEPTDLNQFPWQRSFASTLAFNKLQLGVYPEDLNKYFEIVDKAVSGQQFNLTSLINLKRLNDVMKIRSSAPFRPEEFMWDVAAVIFMDETESPFTYDSEYGKKKIKFWKKHLPVTLFFSQMPVKRLIPYLPATEENSKVYSETMKELSRIEEDISQDTLTNLYAKQQKHLKDLRSSSSAKKTGRNSRP